MFRWFDNNHCHYARFQYQDIAVKDLQIITPTHIPALMLNTFKQCWLNLNWKSWWRCLNLAYHQVKGLLSNHCLFWSEHGRSNRSTETCHQLIHRWSPPSHSKPGRKKVAFRYRNRVGKKAQCYLWSVYLATITVPCIHSTCIAYFTGSKIAETLPKQTCYQVLSYAHT